MAYFVWLRDLRGPTPEVWREHTEIYRKRSEAKILDVRELADAEEREPLERLARKYPLDWERDH
jgi:hypothetical protein